MKKNVDVLTVMITITIFLDYTHVALIVLNLKFTKNQKAKILNYINVITFASLSLRKIIKLVQSKH